MSLSPGSPSYHLYFESYLSPDSFSVLCISDKSTLDYNLNASRVTHFLSRIRKQYPFISEDVYVRMERLLTALHCGWCSCVMDLIKGDLQRILSEKSKKSPDNFMIADIGEGIERLLDTIEISSHLESYCKPLLSVGASLRGNSEADSKAVLGEPLRCLKTALVHPESAFAMCPQKNGTGQETRKSASVVQHVVPDNPQSAHWQLFFDSLARSFQNAAFIAQGNEDEVLDTLLGPRLIDMRRVCEYIGVGIDSESTGHKIECRGRFLRIALEDTAPLYKPTETEVVIDMSSFEAKPILSSNLDFSAFMNARCKVWSSQLELFLDREPPDVQEYVLGFLPELDTMCLPIRYLVLNYLVGDGTMHSLDPVRRGAYYKSIRNIFCATRFFCALALSDTEALDRIIPRVRYPKRRYDEKFTGEEWPKPECIQKEEVAKQWTEFDTVRDRIWERRKYDADTGLWSACKWQFRFYHLSSMVLRWRWCTHVQQDRRFGRIHCAQIRRELTMLANLVPAADEAMPTGMLGTSKKKKKRGLQHKPQRLSPNDLPLLLLVPDPSPDYLVPKKFVGFDNGPAMLSAELEKLMQSANKVCGDPCLAQEVSDRLKVLPAQLQWCFLMHLTKHPFPDLPHSLVNIWSGIPIPESKQERANVILVMVDWIIVLYRLNSTWIECVYNERSDLRPGIEPCIPRLMLFGSRSNRGIMPDKLHLEVGLSWGSGHVTLLQQRWIQSWWRFAHSFINSCALAGYLAESSDLSDLQCLVEQLRQAGCDEVMMDRSPFGSYIDFGPAAHSADIHTAHSELVHSSSLARAVELELSAVLEAKEWLEADDETRINCTIFFVDFLRRNWTVDPIVLDFIQSNELSVLPLVIQFHLLQQLCTTRSRLHQEALVRLTRYTYFTSGLCSLNKHPLSNEVTFRESSGSAENATTTDTTDVDNNLSVSQAEQSRLSSLAIECILLFKIRFKELFGVNRWKFANEKSVINSSLEELKEEVEKATATLSSLREDILSGACQCFSFPVSKGCNGSGDELHCEYHDGWSNAYFSEGKEELMRRLVENGECERKTVSLSSTSPSDILCDTTKTDGTPSDTDDKLRWRIKYLYPKLRNAGIQTTILLKSYNSDFATAQLLDKMWISAMK